MEGSTDWVLIFVGFMRAIWFRPEINAVSCQSAVNRSQGRHRIDHVVNAIKAANQVILTVPWNLICRTLHELRVRQARTLGQVSGRRDTSGIVVDSEESLLG